ncbi:MAG: DUF2914 domain-containing protein [Nitrospirae bacterium]|nr:DUF2914 domain-containing protein [Nitrospirota bacterium]
MLTKPVLEFKYLPLMMAALFLAGFNAPVYGAENQPQEIQVLEGYMVADAGHPASFDNNQSIPVFESEVGRIYAITKITKISENTHLKHLWFLRDTIMMDSTVQVKENQMRSQSGLNIKPQWTGKWRVDITSADGTLLYTIPFIIRQKSSTVQAGAGTGSAAENNPNPAPLSAIPPASVNPPVP